MKMQLKVLYSASAVAATLILPLQAQNVDVETGATSFARQRLMETRDQIVSPEKFQKAPGLNLADWANSVTSNQVSAYSYFDAKPWFLPLDDTKPLEAAGDVARRESAADQLIVTQESTTSMNR